jgi:ABC-2 type transport system ATP-binding protein
MIPGGSVLEVRACAPASDEAAIRDRLTASLSALPDVTKVDSSGSEDGTLSYRLYAAAANTLIGPAAQAVVSAGAEVRDLSVKHPTLEEVFIFLTGRHLR